MQRVFTLRDRLARRLASRNPNGQKRNGWLRKGLTLVELSIVILVLGILMVVLFANLDLGITDKAKKLQVTNASKQLKIWLDQYEYENERLEEGAALTILSQKNPNNPGWKPIDEQSVLDPWKNPYFICSDEAGERQICSLGADGQNGGDGVNADFFLTNSESWPAWLSGKQGQQQ